MLDGVGIDDVDFSGANFSGSLIRNARVSANWSNAVLAGVDFTGTQFLKNDFSDANLLGATLAHATIGRGTALNNANLAFADLTGTFFEPGDVTGIEIYGAKGLSELVFRVPTAVAETRKIARDRGLDAEARLLTASLVKGKLAKSPAYARFFADYIQGGLLTRYGVEPWKPVFVLLGLVPWFAILYVIALVAPGQSAIWVIHFVDSPRDNRPRGTRVTVTLPRMNSTRSMLAGWRPIVTAARIGLYFSLISAFQIGYKDLNLGSGLSRLQRRGYTLKATGWVRTVAGTQALVSVYLLALWALTLFGNPFDT